ncbi:MAG: molecular chaperone HscC [Gammaproteobacteria bacterium HGW-Gammaproteobacteria-6]|nr:MAG: molecular chaperone HscC [Gammaproteobacteria bacterium HGW-Gammaproteobacteria-6]
MAVVGIDLGTTNSLVSAWQNGKSVIIPNALGQLLTPSVVSVDKQGMVLVGRAAKDRLVTHPEYTASQFKRLMGTAEVLTLGKLKYSPEELSSLILKQLKADAETFLGEKVEEAIISVPAYFNNNQRKATLNAAKLANLKVERLINEPTAAALAYGIQESEDERRFIIIDLGGGTLDVSILEKFEDLLEVHATSGDSFLGGEDFTYAMVGAVCEQLGRERQSLSREERAHLYRLCDEAKKALADQSTVQIDASISGKMATINFTRDDFSRCCAGLLERVRDPIERAVRDSGMVRDDFDDVILVGGGSRMPIVRNFVGRLFGRIPSATIDPDLVVAMGAAVQAALKQRNQTIRDTVLTDVCPFSLGIESSQEIGKELKSGFFSVLIPRNTVIPASRSDRFYTVADNQDEMRLAVYQGEQRLVKNNIKIGEFNVPVPRKKAGKEAVDVRFTYDINGVLEVQADVLGSGCRKTLVIQNTTTELDQDEIDRLLKRMEKLKFHPREDSVNLALMGEAERMWAEALGEERQYIEQLIKHFEEAMDSQDPLRSSEARTEVEKRLQELKEQGGRW